MNFKSVDILERFANLKQDTILEKFANLKQDTILEKLMKQVPDMPAMDGMMNGYEFKDGALKASVDYWADKDNGMFEQGGLIYLYSNANYPTDHVVPTFVSTNLSLLIKPNNMAFYYMLVNTKLVNAGETIILPNVKKRVMFSVTCADEEWYQVKKYELLGYGIFIPYIPINNISLTQQNATP